jgi:hypothetical protein
MASRLFVVAALLAGCGGSVVAPVANSSGRFTSVPAAATSPTATPFTAAPPAIANNGLLELARMAGRSDPAVCLFVDPATGIDSTVALLTLQSTVDALVAQGYTPLGARLVAPCPKTPHHIANNTVHPKNSGRGPVSLGETVRSASPYQLFVVLTTASRIDHIFGGSTLRTSSEELMFQGDSGWPVTLSVYVDPPAFADPGKRAYALFDGLGLLSR